MTPEQLAALVADHKRIARHHAGTQMGGRSANTADAIEHLQAEAARLSTPPDDAEVAVLEGWLRNPWSKAAPGTERGPIPEWVYALMHQAADALTSLSHALAAETAKREAMEEAQPDETAALRAKLAEVERELKCVVAERDRAQKACETIVADRDQWRIDCEEFRLERDAALADRDEERKLADDLATWIKAEAEDRGYADGEYPPERQCSGVIARHAARRKEQKG